VRNLAELPLPETAFMAFSVPWWASALVPFALTPLLTFLATVAVNGAEYRTDR
jgi:hypothetical protein